MIRATIEELLAERIIERVEKDPLTAQQELVTAERHLATALSIRHRDPNAAFVVGCDAMRKAITAHMRAAGYRVARRRGIIIGRHATPWLPSTISALRSTSRRSTTCGSFATSPNTTP